MLTVDGAYMPSFNRQLDSLSHPLLSGNFGDAQRFLRPPHGAGKCDRGHELKVQGAYPGESEITLDIYLWVTGLIA